LIPAAGATSCKRSSPRFWEGLFISKKFGGSVNPFLQGAEKTGNQRMNMTTPDYVRHPSSFRDPSGFVFEADGLLYRHVNQSYAGHYELLIRSGLYDALVVKSLLIPHTEIDKNLTGSADWYKTLLPRQIQRISYASEWSPEQLKDAALLTLQIGAIAVEHGMILKDATPYNIQFEQGKPVFLDTLSFEKYDASLPWIAYRQFCECFLFPLYLHYYLRTGINKITAAWPDGIPAATTARLLPLKSRWNTGAWMHVFLQNQVRSDARGSRLGSFSKNKLGYLLDHLKSTVNGLTVKRQAVSAWSNYYSETILGKPYLEAKEKLFRQNLEEIEFKSALDLGANDGYFSRIVAETKRPVLAIDSDWQCINTLYKYTRKQQITNILPLCVDVSNPTPASGFRLAERDSFTSRAHTDLLIVLALVHHLALGKNIPLRLIADYCKDLTDNYLIIEFIPLSDAKARELIVRRNDPPADYHADNFESCFCLHFRIEKKEPIPGTERILYRMKKGSL
jgi:hypothetical protein